MRDCLRSRLCNSRPDMMITLSRVHVRVQQGLALLGFHHCTTRHTQNSLAPGSGPHRLRRPSRRGYVCESFILNPLSSLSSLLSSTAVYLCYLEFFVIQPLRCFRLTSTRVPTRQQVFVSSSCSCHPTTSSSAFDNKDEHVKQQISTQAPWQGTRQRQRWRYLRSIIL